MINLISKGNYKIAWRDGCLINEEVLQTAKALSKTAMDNI
jgi:hypothetical protein